MMGVINRRMHCRDFLEFLAIGSGSEGLRSAYPRQLFPRFIGLAIQGLKTLSITNDFVGGEGTISRNLSSRWELLDFLFWSFLGRKNRVRFQNDGLIPVKDRVGWNLIKRAELAFSSVQ